MALSNRERVGQMFEVLAPALDDFISTAIGENTSAGAEWVKLVEARDAKKGISGKTYDPLDPQVQLRMLTEKAITTSAKQDWYPFSAPLGRTGESFASELREYRNTWAHNGSFSDDDAYRALDTAERLLRLVHAPQEADKVKSIRLNLRRVTADKDDKRTLKTAVSNPESAGLRPWREVLRPHEDVATGNFHASEFAANLYKVAAGADDQGKDYADPVEFFNRTYLTEGLRDLIDRAARRLSGDDNASPVINLQTNFGGGKTHSMLSLWHLAGATPLGDYPQELQELLIASGYEAPETVQRVAIVGNHFSPSGEDKPDGTRVNTVWGELAWQLGGAEGYAIVAEADRTSTPPGKALHTVLERYAPAVILIDEWVAYARSLLGRDDLVGGTFDDQFTFAQSLTEAAKGTSGVLAAISIPASEAGDDSEAVAGSDEEVGGENGLRALKRLQNVVRRVADQWRPASSDEAYRIVRQRLFVEADSEALAAIRATAGAFGDMYSKYSHDFPSETRDPAYGERIKLTYPIHPELFDRLYEDWSSLERFQRTRGVLRLMNTVIHALWVGEDSSPLIMPGSIPLGVAAVNSELTQYLQDSWKAIIDADVDGPNSEPAKIDKEKSLFGQRSLTKRLARAVFFGSVPTIGSAHKGIETQRVFLGTAAPGDVPGNFHSALTQLGDRATYFYSGQGKYWYDLQANITRRARDQAERMHPEDVWAEIVRRLGSQPRNRGSFAGVHVCPTENSDIPDTDEARLVIIHPRLSHSRKESESTALEFAHKATENKGSAHRGYRNMVVFLAGDTDRMAELQTAVREYLAWNTVLSSHDLDLTQNQRNQAEERRSTADSTVDSRLLNTYQWALVPSAPEPSAPFIVSATKVEGQTPSLADRVSKRLGNDGALNTQQAAAAIRLALNRVPKLWEQGHVRVGDLWKVYASYAYMPRLRDQTVLNTGLVEQPLLWETDGFALAQGYDEAEQRYQGLVLPEGGGNIASHVTVNNDLLIVRPEVAEAQRDAESATEPAGESDERTPDDTGAGDSAHSVAGQNASEASGGTSPTRRPPQRTRFFGSKQLSEERYALDFKKIADEVLAHLSAAPGTDLVVRVEIEATNPSGFDETKTRTVSENARTLKFDQSGFEES
ncbi:Swt1 family HEPN domain-containing protein [Streptomonospora wellingtoniae]|uniref:Swt1 family HEPN domain-containing protein n=1 Tax=Streptomonospora wellingtoniae TaxID=3075544 RepID=A0ABU2KMX6_9ACTN|nr:Swt1 family HEPN domain-containing protein [Streptomonospora sp. DSM 45055]MDT0300612.1 Swt1 family HEPN domain-containing protein [Streptomonospora sp. DSM 45055]